MAKRNLNTMMNFSDDDEEKDFQKEFVKHLTDEDGYIERSCGSDYNRELAMDIGLLWKFVENTQPDVIQALIRGCDGDEGKAKNKLAKYIRNQTQSKGDNLVNVLRNGVDIESKHIDLMYSRPTTKMNPVQFEKYQANIFSVMQEVVISDEERVDVVTFINGLPIMSFELKFSVNQSYRNAIAQYKKDRNPKNPLFDFTSGCIVNFAMDENEVYMTTRLQKEKTQFRPFNIGKGEDIDTGAGNPKYKDKYSVCYMWEDILTKDTVTDLLSKFVFVSKEKDKDIDTGKIKEREQLIFPRYHQLDLVRKILADVKKNKTKHNYLAQHSAGSGKTNSIAWLAYRLATLHDDGDNIIFDTVIVMTDRVVVDRQLQSAIGKLERVSGMVRKMDDDCTSIDLKNALMGNTKIVVTTIQKFPYIVDDVTNLKEKNFAVIIDEAHASTAGKDMMAVLNSLTSESDEEEYENAQDVIEGILSHSGKAENVSVFAFTATPKQMTLKLFGTLNDDGQYQAFHMYSMKQAIEEEYILDVLQNYTEYDTMFRLNKEVEEDPVLQTSDAKKQIARFVELHETNITQRIQVIVEHFRNVVMGSCGGEEKAMVITSLREEAVKYRQAFQDYIDKKGYTDLKALVSFSGKVSVDDAEYTEVGMNGIREEQLPAAFDGDDYNVLIVANKYQTGFDQKKLCAMYVIKTLKGVNAVQTLSRLNRCWDGRDKKTFVLDFANSYKDINNAFKRFYTTTILSGDITIGHLKELKTNVDAFHVLNPQYVDEFTKLVLKTEELTPADKKQIRWYIQDGVDQYNKLSKDDKNEFRLKVRGFIKCYEFMFQATSLDDAEMYKTYHFALYLMNMLDQNTGTTHFDISDKIKADRFKQVEGETHKKSDIKSAPIVNLSSPDGTSISEPQTAKLSEIIDEINSRTGSGHDKDVAVKSVLQVIDMLLKSDELRASAKSNTEKDFELSFYSAVDDILIEVLSLNQSWFSALLNDEATKKKVLGVFEREVYDMLRESEDE